ncbi:MAG: peroxiredoxin family protein [Planctomycetaceae bacterium]|jgi:hypothetical protein|nr:peroxiredoxin family protein [Planctomycetaceae bacterium]
MKVNFINKFFVALFFVAVICLLMFTNLRAQETDVTDKLLTALKFKPVQKDVDYDIPTETEIPQCKISLYENKRGYIVTNPQNHTLRIFFDKNADGQIDQWSYYKNGVEVYRDVATAGNGKPDQFRWLNHAGTRTGVDVNRDTIIDYWKNISPEEVSREIVLAVSTNDVARFLRVTLSRDELQTLGLSNNLNDNLVKKITGLQNSFAESVRAMNLGSGLQWYQLNAGFPGTVPAGSGGQVVDLTVYENTIATVGIGKETKQISIGTIVNVGENNWRAIDVPKLYDDAVAVYTFIPQAALPAAANQSDNEIIKIINEYQKLAAEISVLPDNQKPAQHKKAMNLMLQIINLSATEKDRELWIRLMADEIMEAAQKKELPDADNYISQIYKSVSESGNTELAAYVRYRQIMTEYHTTKEDEVKAYTAWMTNLENFVTEKRFEATETGLEVMLQLAGNREMSSRTGEEPLKWYGRIVELAGNKPIAAKAAGAIRRLQSVGKQVPFQATDSTGKRFDISAYRGNYVLLCFWDSNISDQNTLKAIKRETDRLKESGVKTVGVNLDNNVETLNAKAAELGMQTWTQLFTQGGFDNQMATYWGIQNVPSLILYGKDGNVLKANISSINEIQNIIENNK